MITKPNVKLNLGLNVLRKRSDGYHDLETLFVPYFGINDCLEIVEGKDYSRTSASLFERYVQKGQLVQGLSDDGKVMITIARKDGVDWNPLSDLTAKAYFLLAADYDLPPVKIFLEKTSPVGAGLGGGSADAAFALSMLSEMFALGLQQNELAGYAARLGSDCSFFVYNRPMFGSGRGELLEDYPLDNIDFGDGCPDKEFFVRPVIPEGINVSTAQAYRGITPKLPDIPLREMLARPIDEWKNGLENDFEKTVFAIYPSLENIKGQLYEMGAVYASMSGSGSAMYGIFRRQC